MNIQRYCAKEPAIFCCSVCLSTSFFEKRGNDVMRVMALVVGILLTWIPGSFAEALQFPEISSWKNTAEIQSFIPKTLYEYINGAADLYLACDFEELNVAEYGNEKKASVIVEAYRHATPEDAFGIYSQERLPDGNFLNIGAEGYIDQHVLNFVSGRYYVKINSFNTGAEDREVLLLFAKKMAADLGEKGGLPSILTAFPAEGKRSHSEKYITRNFLGYPFLHSAFTADYESVGRKFKLFLIDAVKVDESRNIIQQYLRQIKSPVKEISEGRYTLADPYHGIIDLVWKGRYILGIADLPDEGLRSKFLKRFEEEIQKRK